MFKVAFIKHVFDAEHEDSNARFAVLSREESIPFAPAVGQEIQWPLAQAQKIIRVSWSVERQGFTCRLEDEYTVNLDIDAPDFEETLENAPTAGWTVSSTYPRSR